MSQFIEMFEGDKYPSVKLSDIASEWLKGQSFRKDDIVDNGNSMCIHYGELFTKYGPIINQVLSRTNVEGKRTSKVGDILFPASDVTPNGLARCSMLPYDNIILGGDIIVLRPKRDCNAAYLSYAINQQTAQLLIRVNGAVVKHMSAKALMTVVIPMPPLEEQNRFVSLAQQADKSKFVGFKSQFIEMSKAWPVMKLNGHVDIIRGVSYKPSDVVSSLDANSVGILRANNIANGEINTNEMVYVDQARVSDAQRIRIGDIVVCASSGSQSLVGKAAINKNLTREYAHGAFCLLIRCNNTILPKYLNIYLQTALYRNQIESLSCGSNILNIKADHLTSLDIPIPDIKQQSDFVTIIEQADKSKYFS